MIGWKAWYTEGRTYCSTEYNWKDLPDEGVLCVVVFKDWIPSSNKTRRYRRINDGDLWYFHLKDTIVCSPDDRDEIKKRYPQARDIKRGVWDGDAIFDDVSKEAANTRWHDEELRTPQEKHACR